MLVLVVLCWWWCVGGVVFFKEKKKKKNKSAPTIEYISESFDAEIFECAQFPKDVMG